MGDTLAAALIELQGRLPRITKADRAQSGNRETKYANLATITEAAFPLLGPLGLYWTCAPTMDAPGGQFVLRWKLGHVNGEELTGDYPLPSSNSQTMGGAITYARRYAFCAVTGIAPAEDDDEAASQARAAEQRQEQRTRYVTDERQMGRIENMDKPPRPAERIRGQLPEDQWTTPNASS